jgi:hypothetical protein
VVAQSGGVVAQSGGVVAQLGGVVAQWIQGSRVQIPASPKAGTIGKVL